MSPAKSGLSHPGGRQPSNRLNWQAPLLNSRTLADFRIVNRFT